MAKGDHARVGTAVTEQGQNAQQGLDATRANNQALYGNMNQNYGYGSQQNIADYNSIMNNYREFLGGASDRGLGQSLDTFGNFAQTGGFSPQDIQNIRARAVAPIRGVYSNARADVDRQRRLQHGFSPNYTAATAKMGRDQAYSTADASTNAEAMIAELLQKGKLAGAEGLAGTSLGARGQDQSALGGMSNLYGQTPGLASTFGNQVLAAGNQDLQGQQLQNQIMEAIIRGRLGESGVAGSYQSALGNIGGTVSLIGNIMSGGTLGALGGLRGGGGTSNDWQTGQYS